MSGSGSPSDLVRGPEAGLDGDARVLGQAIAARLLSAGIELNSSLMQCRDCPAEDQIRHAVADLDEAVKGLHRLMFLLPGLALDTDPDAIP